MAFDLDEYAAEAHRAVQTIIRVIDPSSNLNYRQMLEGRRITRTEIHGYFKRNGVYVMDVKEVFNLRADGTVDRVYRYTFLANREELLAMETQPRQPNHAHFPPKYSRGTLRHFPLDRHPETRDMTFLKAFDFFNLFVNGEGRLPEPFFSA